MTTDSNEGTSPFVLRLFVCGTTARSQRAISNTRKICDEFIGAEVELQVTDVYIDPEATRDYQVIATPTLVRVSPGPLRRVIGDLSDRAKVLTLLNLPPTEAGSQP